MWWKRKRRKEPDDVLVVDTDRRTIPLGDPTDPTSMLFTLCMVYGPAALTWDEQKGLWHLSIPGQGEWDGTSQVAVLDAAWTALEARS